MQVVPDRAQAVVAGQAAADLHLQAPTGRSSSSWTTTSFSSSLEAEPTHEGPHGLARLVHVGRAGTARARPSAGDVDLVELAGTPAALPEGAVALRQQVDDRGPDVVPGALVVAARVGQADDQEVSRGPAALAAAPPRMASASRLGGLVAARVAATVAATTVSGGLGPALAGLSGLFGRLLVLHRLDGGPADLGADDDLVLVHLGAHTGRAGSGRRPGRFLESCSSISETSTVSSLGMAPGLAYTDRAEEEVGDGAVLPLDLLRRALEHDRDLDLDLDVAGDPQEVDVDHVATDRVPLDVLDDGEVLAAVDIEGDQGVEPGLGDQRGPQIGPLHGDGHRVLVQAVDDTRDLAVPQEAAGGSGAEGAPGLP